MSALIGSYRKHLLLGQFCAAIRGSGCRATAFNTVLHVVIVRADVEVKWVAADSIVATMAHDHAVNWLAEK